MNKRNLQPDNSSENSPESEQNDQWEYNNLLIGVLTYALIGLAVGYFFNMLFVMVIFGLLAFHRAIPALFPQRKKETNNG